jgi:hypothetical protein
VQQQEEATSVENAPEIVFGLQKGGAVRYPRLEVVPAGTKVYTTDELGDLKLKDLEDLYWQITGKTPEPKFRTKVNGVFNIVQEVLKYPLVDEKTVEEQEVAAVEENKAAAAKDRKGRYGPPQRNKVSKFELLSTTDKSRLMKMPPQAQAVLRIIVAEVVKTGSSIIDIQRMAVIMEEGKEEMHTEQHSWRIFSYYKSMLVSRDILREY